MTTLKQALWNDYNKLDLKPLTLIIHSQSTCIDSQDVYTKYHSTTDTPLIGDTITIIQYSFTFQTNDILLVIHKLHKNNISSTPLLQSQPIINLNSTKIYFTIKKFQLRQLIEQKMQNQIKLSPLLFTQQQQLFNFKLNLNNTYYKYDNYPNLIIFSKVPVREQFVQVLSSDKLIDEEQAQQQNYNQESTSPKVKSDIDIQRLKYDNNILKDIDHPIVRSIIQKNEMKIKEVERLRSRSKEK